MEIVTSQWSEPGNHLADRGLVHSNGDPSLTVFGTDDGKYKVSDLPTSVRKSEAPTSGDARALSMPNASPEVLL